MAKLALSRDLLGDFAKLERRTQNRVSELADKFQRMTAAELRSAKGIHLESYDNAKDRRARTVRIDDNHRGVVIDLGDDQTYVLTRIGTHDDIDRWMLHNRSRVNDVTGALEILNVDAISAAVEELRQAAPSPASLFAHRSEKEFRQLGVDVDLLPALMAFTSEDQLQPFLSLLPQTQAEALIGLTGQEPVEVLYAEIAGDVKPGSIATDDLVAALDAPASRAQFRVMANEQELAAVLALPLAQWRIYLHPSQERVAKRPTFNGAVRVTGGAGTGKTVVAMHRAATLAAALQDRSGSPILFTTYTRNLAEAIERDLRLLGGSDLLDRVEVLNVDRVAYRIVQEAQGSHPKIAADHLVGRLWNDVVDEEGIDFTPAFLHSEWEQIILAQACSGRSDYFSAPRTGRGTRLDRRGRAEVWRAVESLTNRLVERGLRTYLQIAQAAAGYLEARQVKPYRHVIVDEAQDLHEQQWRVLRAAVAKGPNDLFIVGDSHQRIYDRRSSLSKVGIDIVGRSYKLRINYRTTHEILAWALTLLGDASYDDLDTGTDSHLFAGYHSYLHGPRPTLLGAKTKRESYHALTEQLINWIDQGVAPEEIAVAARSSAGFDAVRAALESAGIGVSVLDHSLPTVDSVRLTTMHRMKGLEFRCVAVIDADADTVPANWELTDRHADELQHEADLRRERCLLYVACTRAREDLWITWSGKPSQFLHSMPSWG